MNPVRKTLILALALLLPLGTAGQRIRTNYRSGGILHISTEYENLSVGGVPAQARVERAGFSDGTSLYLLYLVLEQKTAVSVPKGVKMAATLGSGKLVRIEQIGDNSATPRRLENGLFLNRLKYAVEPGDMDKLCGGITGVDIITGWDPDDYLQASFGADELGSLLRRHCAAIQEVSAQTVDLTATLSGYTDNQNSLLATTEPMMGRGATLDYNILLSYLYYKNTNTEDVDLAFVIGSEQRYHIPYDAPVRFTLCDGTELSLQQTRDDVNFVYVYPSLEDVQKMVRVGLASLSITYEGGVLTDTFPPRQDNFMSFVQAVNQQLQLLLSVSPR